ncbi:unnamed protein product [Brassicogethes aeneus]|uniref:Uncharacterized protein n=1 Tax=Brassicogethes aeneus TaxID=1431903 RepID=A0A9P0AY91_BRAAE|nr:unnamed protein product [Brassicogethes aeneus]
MARSKEKSNENKKANHEEQKKRQREAMRRLRESRRLDPVTYEEDKWKERERYYQRKEAGKIKTIEQMTDREKRTQRKDWRNRSKLQYDRKKNTRQVEIRLQDDSSPPSPIQEEFIADPYDERLQARNDGRKRQGRLRRRKHRKALNREISVLKAKLKKEKRKKEKYRMRLKRVKNKLCKNIHSPTKKVEALIEGQIVSPAVKKKLLFSEVIEKQLTENYRVLTKPAQKRIFWKCISGNVIKKYKQKSYLKKTTSVFTSEKNKSRTRLIKQEFIWQQIINFLEKDECSRLCPGKNDYVTKKHVKKQKRILNDTLKNLHRKFMKENKFLISYTTFCRLRPFWIVQPKIDERNTCLCLIHTNMWLLVRRLKIANIIKENSPEEVCKTICCEGEVLKETCLERKCENCKDKTIVTVDFDGADTMVYEKWVTKRVTIVVKGKEKLCTKTVKEKLMSTKAEVYETFIGLMKPFLLHIKNLEHQMREIRKIKENMNNNEALIHMDFSENYGCKYAEEVQSAHFGNSKMQLSLHTVVVYYKSSNNDMQKKCFCTVSPSLRHDPVAICAHLLPVFRKLKTFVENLKHIHFLSDGPSTQYRNRKMFYLMANFISQELNVEELRWHYSEKGHGKGAPDGVGGVLKRTADGIVARGTDIHNLQSFLFHLKANCKGIFLFKVQLDDSELEKIEEKIPKILPTYKGVLQCHEVVWSKQHTFLDIRKLTCLSCSPSKVCSHYSLAHTLTKGRLIYSNIYSSSSDDEEDNLLLARLLNRKPDSCLSPKENHSRTTDFDCDIHLDNVMSTRIDVQSSHSILTNLEPKINDYVVVKFCTKKLVKHYIGVIQSTELEDYPNDYLIKFVKKKTGTDKFFFPVREDISLISKTDVVSVLPPVIVLDREQLFFNTDLSLFSNIN